MSSKNIRSSWHKDTTSGGKVFPVAAAGIVIAIVLYLLQANGMFTLKNGDSGDLRLLRFSEVQTENITTTLDPQGEPSDWIEIQNTGDTAVSLKGVSILCDTDVNDIFTFPDITLDGGAYAIVYCGSSAGSNNMTADFSLSAAGGNTLSLFDQANDLLDSVELPELGEDEAWCRDASGEWVKTSKPTPGAANTAVSTDESNAAETETAAAVTPVNGEIEISEAMTTNNYYCAAPDGNFYDYIELHNASGQAVDLSGMYLTDDPASLKKWALPERTLGADEYMIVYCSGLEDADASQGCHANFKLSADGESVCLADADGNIISAAVIPTMECGEAISLVSGEMTTELAPTPGMANTPENAASVNAQLRGAGNFPVYINEVMASPVDQNCDWIELYNSGSETIDLGQYYLSDDLGHPRKWQFTGSTSIAPGEYKIICLVGSGGSDVAGYMSAPFALPSIGGYTVCLADSDGKVLDAVRLGQQYSGISYGRTTGGSMGYFENATLGTANPTTCMLGKASKAQYSVAGGLFNTGDSFTVTLSCPSGSIYYTTDCTDPTQGSTLYTGTPITVNSTTIIRTRVYRDGYLPSMMDTQSYLFDINNAGDVAYVISLVSDPDGLYSDESGILVMGPNATSDFPYGSYGKGANFWMDWERESHIEMFTTSGTAVSQECGIKVRGRNSRAYELKGLKVNASAKYGTNRFYYPIFSQREYTDYDKIFLRYTGQDYQHAFMRDPVIMSFCKYTEVMYMETELSVVYINGEYYSAMNVREPIDALQICRYNDWPESDADSLDIVKGGYNVLQGSDDTFVELKDWLANHNADTDETYQYIDEHIDIDSYIDYICVFSLGDQPDTINVKRYRNPNADGKWHWAYYDADRGLRSDEDPFTMLAQDTTAQLFTSCVGNTKIRERLFARINELYSTAFIAENFTAAIDAETAKLQPVMPDYLKMFDISMESWQKDVSSFKNKMVKRPAQVIKHAVTYFNLTEEQMYAYFPDAIAKINEAGSANS